ncbi:MAG: helix-turn-helix domain-containing protein [Thermoleophilaceae bacterium]
MSKQAAGVVDRRLAKALSHPLRAHVLAILNERVASPNQIANELEEPLGNVSYHVKTLAELGCIELVRTEPRRGAIEHFYRAVVRPFFSDKDWKRLPPSARQGISDATLQLIWEDTSDALNAGTFDRRVDRHLSRSRLALDDQGWEEVNELLLETMNRVVEIEAESAKRRAVDGGSGFNTKVVLMHFESSGSAEGRKRSRPNRAKRAKKTR